MPSCFQKIVSVAIMAQVLFLFEPMAPRVRRTPNDRVDCDALLKLLTPAALLKTAPWDWGHFVLPEISAQPGARLGQPEDNLPRSLGEVAGGRSLWFPTTDEHPASVDGVASHARHQATRRHAIVALLGKRLG